MPSWSASEANQASTSPTSWTCAARSPLRTAWASSPSSSVSHATVEGTPRARSRSPYVSAMSCWNAARSIRRAYGVANPSTFPTDVVAGAARSAEKIGVVELRRAVALPVERDPLVAAPETAPAVGTHRPVADHDAGIGHAGPAAEVPPLDRRQHRSLGAGTAVGVDPHLAAAARRGHHRGEDRQAA